MDYHALNAMLNLYDENGHIQFDMDRLAARQYFLQHVNQNTVFFHNLKEKIDYLIEEGYYEKALFELYDFSFIKNFLNVLMHLSFVSLLFWVHLSIIRAIH